MNRQVIVIGVSMGGVEALQELFGSLERGFKTPTIAVIHVPHAAQIDFPVIFNMFPGTVVEVRDKMRLEKRHLYFAPPDYHVMLESDGTLSLSQDDAVHFARPSIDVLFETAAYAFQEKVCGVLLTGANQDGAEGLRLIRSMGGTTLVQDPKTAVAPTMPNSALEIMTPDAVLSIKEIARRLSRD